MIVCPKCKLIARCQRDGDAGDIFSLAERPHGVAASPDGTKLELCVQHARDPGRDRKLVPKLACKDYQIDLNNTGSGIDHPDQQFFENYGCGSERNYTGYCSVELEKLFVEQLSMVDQESGQLVWQIDKKLQEDGARPITYHTRLATCTQPRLKGLIIMANSQYNGWRMEDVWLER